MTTPPSSLELEHIDIQPRQRQDMGDVTSLMESIKELGLIQPIVIEMMTTYDERGEMVQFPRLVAGRRRLSALMQLGFKEVFHGSSCDPTRPGFVFYNEQTELKRQLVELEEDVRRKDRTWQEKVIGIDRVHKIKVAISFDEGVEWGQKQTGELLDMSRAKISYTLRLADEILRDREGEIAKAPTYTDAIKILLDREIKVAEEEQMRRRLLAALPQGVEQHDGSTGLPLFEEQETVEATKIKLSSIVINDKFELVANTLAPGSVDCVLLLGQLMEEGWKQVERLVRNDSYLIVRAEDAIWWRTCFPANSHSCIAWPVIWNILGVPPDESFPFVDNTKSFLVLTKGRPKPFNPSPSCVFSAHRDGEWPPASLIEFLLRPTSAIGSTILMPCGGPSVAVARLGRFPLSFEPDKARFDAEREALREHYETTLPKVEFV